MRLSKMKEIIAHNLPYLSLQTETKSASVVVINNLKEVRDAASRISEVDSLRDAAEKVIGQAPLVQDGVPFSCATEVHRELQKATQTLISRAATGLSFLHSSVPDAKVGTVYIKLPPTNELSEVRKNVDLLDKSLSQLFSGQEGAPNIKFAGVESGSEWLILLVEGGRGLKVFFDLLKSVMDIAASKQKMDKELLEMEKLKAETALITSQTELNNQKMKFLKQVAAKSLVTAYGKHPDVAGPSEDIIRYTKSIDGLLELFDKGSDIELPKVTYDAQKDSALAVEQKSHELENAKNDILLLTEPKDPNED